MFTARSNKFSIQIKGGKWIGEEDTQVGRRYALERELGRGGVGVVLLARDRQLERWVAVKRLQVGSGDSAERASFAIAEAKRLARLQHPNIVTVYDVLEHRGDVLIIMEHLSGYTLEQLQDPLPLEDFVQVARQSLAALAAAHALDMVHLDIKGTNIMLTWLSTGHLQVKLLDFGLATIMESPSLQSLDEGGSLLGSVYTMAPEQFEQAPVGAFTDLYSLGCVFYHALTRQEPFEGATSEEVMEAHLQHVPKPLAPLRPDLPPALCCWVEKLMSRNPADRPASASRAMSELFAAISSLRIQGQERASGFRPQPPFGRRAGDKGAEQRTSAGLPTEPAVSLETGIELVDPLRPEALANALGRLITIEAVVERVWENSDGTIRFLNFRGLSHNNFSVLVKGDAPAFAKDRLESFLTNKIRVSGNLSEFHGCPQIIVDAPGQIEMCREA